MGNTIICSYKTAKFIDLFLLRLNAVGTYCRYFRDHNLQNCIEDTQIHKWFKIGNFINGSKLLQLPSFTNCLIQANAY